MTRIREAFETKAGMYDDTIGPPKRALDAAKAMSKNAADFEPMHNTAENKALIARYKKAAAALLRAAEEAMAAAEDLA